MPLEFEPKPPVIKDDSIPIVTKTHIVKTEFIKESLKVRKNIYSYIHTQYS